MLNYCLYLKCNLFMKPVFILLFIANTIVFNTFSQSDETLITIGEKEVSMGEFERIYRKNNNNLYNEEEKKTPEEYLDLFIDFKLKVIEAENSGMDTNSVFINELAGYRKELAAPYLTDVKYNEQMVYELYKRTTKEIRASHLLLKLPENVSPEIEEGVLDSILQIRQQIINGKDFADAAVEFSEDPSVSRNKGDLGYFTAFQMVVPFENAAFSTPVGEVSEPVRTSFGYHLLQVYDIRENRGEIQVAHIMKMFPKDVTPEIKAELKESIDSIYQELLNGADFAELAKTKSDDKRSAVNGGEMAWFSAARMVPEFAEVSFALKNIGDISEPIATDYGYHIIKKLDIRPVPSFEESKANLETRIKQDPQRSITSKKVFIDKLKEEYSFAVNQEGKEKLKYKYTNLPFEESFELFNIDNRSYTVNEYEIYLNSIGADSIPYLSKLNEWIEFEITELEDSKLEDKYPDFRYLLQEYHDGILLFNISEEKIWNFASEDSIGLEAYYQKNKDKYHWEERFKGLIVTCKASAVREEADKYFSAGMTVEEILDQINTEEESLITIKEGAWENGSNAIVDYYVWNGTTPANFNSELTFIRGDNIPPEPKSLDEARGLYISDYQKYLENKWIKELRKKYKIKVNKKLLKTIESV